MQHTRRQFTRNALLATASCTTLTQHLFAQASTTDYIVRKGDTLSHIALRYGVKISDLKQLNNLRSDTVRIGQKLRIPGQPTTRPPTSSTVHIVQKGDTLGHIALHYGTTVRSIQHANNLNSDLVRVGQELRVPAGVTTTRPPDLLAKVRAETARINVRCDNWKRIVVHHSAIKYGNLVLTLGFLQSLNSPHSLCL